MQNQPDTLTIKIPDWLQNYARIAHPFETLEARMRFVIEASRRNVINASGGPFAAAVFETKHAKLIALGTNLVTSQKLSTLHAEMVALMLAQRVLERYDLSADHDAAYQLVCSAEPCAMCFGAIPWSGISEVISAATDADVRAIGFDEGPKVSDWQKAYTQRGISTKIAFLRHEATEVLEFYRESHGAIYNAALAKEPLRDS